MNLKFKHLGLAACALWCAGLSLSAKVERTTVYMFGFSASFTDSVAYITDIQQLDSAYIDTKTDFLMDRVVYSEQLQTYVEAMELMGNCTCSVFFHTKKNKLQEEYEKIKKRYREDQGVVLKELEPGSFVFVSPVYMPPSAGIVEPESDSTAVKGKAKKKSEKKAKKQGDK